MILLSNAKDALINKHSENPKIILKVISQKDFYKLLIQDNGVGISDDISEKIFEPYFNKT